MRFMVIVKAGQDREAGAMPEDQRIDAMGKYHEELHKAGVPVDASGLGERTEKLSTRNR